MFLWTIHFLKILKEKKCCHTIFLNVIVHENIDFLETSFFFEKKLSSQKIKRLYKKFFCNYEKRLFQSW